MTYQSAFWGASMQSTQTNRSRCVNTPARSPLKWDKEASRIHQQLLVLVFSAGCHPESNPVLSFDPILLHSLFSYRYFRLLPNNHGEWVFVHVSASGCVEWWGAGGDGSAKCNIHNRSVRCVSHLV